MTPLQSLIASGTKVWLDSIDPDEIRRNAAWGITGATSNPIIIAYLVKGGRFDAELSAFIRDGLDDEAISWRLTDMLVQRAQTVFEPVWARTRGDDGWVSFELDPLLEDPAKHVRADVAVDHARTGQRIERGREHQLREAVRIMRDLIVRLERR